MNLLEDFGTAELQQDLQLRKTLRNLRKNFQEDLELSAGFWSSRNLTEVRGSSRKSTGVCGIVVKDLKSPTIENDSVTVPRSPRTGNED